MQPHQPIKLSLPNNGPLENDSLEFLDAAGLQVHKTFPNQYLADIPTLPDLGVIFQHTSNIVVSVNHGSVEFGITGLDVIEEKRSENDDVLVIHDALNFGHCTLMMAVPEVLESVKDIASLKNFATALKHPLRVATKFPTLTARFLNQHSIPHALIVTEGTLEIAASTGYADVISDLVTSGQTLKVNRLRPLDDGIILPSQAVLIANRKVLKARPSVLETARLLLEYIESYLRAKENLLVIANIRAENPEAIAQKVFNQTSVSSLQGANINPAIMRDGGNWYSVSVVVRRDHLLNAITDLRLIGSDAITVSSANYIFWGEPSRYKVLLDTLR